MKVEKIMCQSIITVGMDDTLKKVKEIFDNNLFHHLFVIESGKLVGAFSDRDLLKFLSPTIGTAAETSADIAILNKKVHQIMTRHPITLAPDADIYDAIGLLIKKDISCIPIVDEKKSLVGIISWRDILKVIARSRA